jgi:hypothetical protein
MNKNFILGFILILVGGFLLVQKLLGIDISVWNFIWPLFLLIPGILMQAKYFSAGNSSNNYLLAGILVTFGLVFLINNITNGVYSNFLSFGYPLGIGIGFLENYTFSQRKSSDLSIGIIFVVISIYILLKAIFPSAYYLRDYLLPGGLICFGIMVLIRNKN